MDEIDPKAFQEMEEVKEMIAMENHVAARDKLLKLKSQFPSIAKEFSSMISVCDVLNSAKFDFSHGESDWYFILQVPQAASEEDVESQYKKISTLLKKSIEPHFIAAESALKIVEEAYSVLSNPETRSIFDKKRAIKFKDPQLNLFSDDCNVQECFSFDNNTKSSEHFEVGQVWAAYDHECMPRSYFQIHKIEKNPLKFHVKSLRPASLSSLGLPIVCGVFHVEKNNETKMIMKPAMFSHIVCECDYDDASEEILIHPKEHEVWAIYRELDYHPGGKCSQDNLKLEVVEIVSPCTKSGNMLAARLIKVDGFKLNNVFRRQNDHGQVFSIASDELYKFSHRIPARRFVGGDMDDGHCMFELDPYAVPSMTDSGASESFEPENKWGIGDFSCDQIWAVRDDPDAMPRRYVVVKNVGEEGTISVTFLEPILISSDMKRWFEQGLPIACGSFKKGKSTKILRVCQFSHVVECEKSQYDSFYIYPKKGEVWAMYKNWNCKWDFTSCNQQYQIVEIVADLAEGSEICVASLVEVKGFMTLFQRQRCDSGCELMIPRKEFLSFSHRTVASRVQTTEENGTSMPYWHIEPHYLGP